MADSDNKRLLAALEANWQAEIEGHHTYSALVKGETDPQLGNVLRGLAAAEKASCRPFGWTHSGTGWTGAQHAGNGSGQADSLATWVRTSPA
jgi:hypothetical protein